MSEAIEQKIDKITGEAQRGFAGLYKEIKNATAKLDKAEVNPVRVKGLDKKILSFMNKYKEISKLQHSKVFDQLSQTAQDQVTWLDGLLSDLNNMFKRNDWAFKVAAFDPKKNIKKLLEALKKAQREKKHVGVGTLVKQIEKGVDVHNPGISFLPMAVILALIAQTILKYLTGRPKGS